MQWFLLGLCFSYITKSLESMEKNVQGCSRKNSISSFVLFRHVVRADNTVEELS